MFGSSSPGRLMARAVTVSGLLVAGTVGTAAVALAHHPEIAATTECGGIVHFTATAWQTSSTAARTNPTIGVSYSTNGGASFVNLPQLAAYYFGSDNDYAFSDTINLKDLTGSLPASVVIKATALAKWANGAASGSSRQTGVLTLTGCPAQPSASISEVSCSNGAATVKLNNDGDDAVEFTVSGPDGVSTHSVAGHGTKSLTKDVAEDADATYSVSADGMSTVTKAVHRDCTQPAPTALFANGENCSFDVTFGNALGTQDAVFSVADTSGNTAEVTVAPGQETTRNHVVDPGTSDTVTVTSPGMSTATHTLSCAAAELPPVQGPPVEQPPTEQPPTEQPPTEEPPTEEPPTEEPPVQGPPAEQPPTETPGSTPVVETPETPGSSVLGTHTSKTTKPARPAPSVASASAQRQLPFTGTNTAELLIAGFLALAFGAALTTAGRRRGDVR
ncbi:MAG: hypothetical protein QOG53_1592 [Frankiales bacterium]|nr:hypothetical protein [Frankiales bacterium]